MEKEFIVAHVLGFLAFNMKKIKINVFIYNNYFILEKL
jgi:hypothetical protein